MLGSNIHLVKYDGNNLACTKTKPVTIIGFKHLKHASIVKKNIAAWDFKVDKKSVVEYHISFVKKRDVPLDKIEVVTSSLEYIGLLSKLNDVGLIVASEVFLDQNFIKMLVDNRDEINRIYTDMRMVRGNLEKIFNEDALD